jgi:flavin reductase (DIM6/NTAB) family NADH-FMN oxidoreductase RutF
LPPEYETLISAELSPLENYKLLIGAIIPRPIAWVTTLGQGGIVNAAPFSAFTFVCSDPPMLGFNAGRRDGELKDTPRNVEAMKEFVVNIVSVPLAQQMHQTSADYPPGTSELVAVGLTAVPSRSIRTPGILEAPVRMECRLHAIHHFGVGPAWFMVGEVVAFHIRKDIIQNGKIDSFALDPLCRLGGPNYATLGEGISLNLDPV